MAIVNSLRESRQRGLSSTELAQRFEVSTRTIKRDVSALIETGVPIIANDGRDGGYRLNRNAALPPMTFTSGELLAVATALAAEPHIPFAPDGRAALLKVLGAIPQPAKAELITVSERIWMRQPTIKGRGKCARLIDEAIRTGVVVNIDYKAGNGAETKGRAVEPMILARTAGHWYLLAWCRMRKEGRWFRFDRIRKAKLTTEPTPDRDIAAIFGEPPDDSHPVRIAQYLD